MKQLLLDINKKVPPSLDSFIVGRHAEVVHLLQLFMQRIAGTYGERTVYLWGESATGKSHLLRALENDSATRYMDASTSPVDMEYSSDISLYLIDNCQRLDNDQQIAAFNLFNQVKENNAFFVATGSSPPALLNVREDLRTRLGWGLIYQLHGLSDEEKIAALEAAASARSITLPASVLSWLIHHYQRDMPSLSSTVEALILLSLETKRPITLPLLRELIYMNECHA